MGTGYLSVKTATANGVVLLEHVLITITDESGVKLYEFHTNEMGYAPPVELDTPDKLYMFEPEPPKRPYQTYHLTAYLPGYTTEYYKGVSIYGDTTSLLEINMSPAPIGGEEGVFEYEIDGHKLFEPETQQQVGPNEAGIMPRILPEVTIPNFVRVKLGQEDNASASVVSVPCITYIKTVTSYEIYDAWPEEAITANVYCIVSFTLNRVYTETHCYRKL